jgi:hypothetical protein
VNNDKLSGEPILSNFVAFDLEGTLTASVAWEGMRDYLLAHDEG